MSTRDRPHLHRLLPHLLHLRNCASSSSSGDCLATLAEAESLFGLQDQRHVGNLTPI